MSYVSSYHHCVFSTKGRQRLITPALRERLRTFLGSIAGQNRTKTLLNETNAICDIEFQPSLRDSRCAACRPSVETLGYFRLSLRDKQSHRQILKRVTTAPFK